MSNVEWKCICRRRRNRHKGSLETRPRFVQILAASTRRSRTSLAQPMNTQAALLVFCLALTASPAGAQSFSWAQRAGGPDSEVATAMARDSQGNAVVTGYFRNANSTFGGQILTNRGNSDVFMAKYDSAGNL